MVYNISMKVSSLFENEQATALFDRFLPGMWDMVQKKPQAAQLSVEQLIRYSRVPRAEEVIKAMDMELKGLNTPENVITPSEAKLIERFLQIDREDKEKSTARKIHRQGAVYPALA